MKILLNITIWCLLCFIYITNSQSQYYEYQFRPSANVDPDGLANYSLYIPEEVGIIKGIHCVIPGWQGNSLTHVYHKTYQEFVAEKGFALMGFQMLGAYTDYYDGVSLWSGEAFVAALKELSILSGHPELEFAPLLLEGYSAGGQFAYHFTQWKPERVIAFVTVKGGYHSLSAAGGAISVPGYLFIGENDLEYRKNNLETIFETNRANGAIWSIAIEPNSGHEFNQQGLLFSYFNSIIPLRLPGTITDGAIPALKEIEEHRGWLGNRGTFEITTYSEYASNKSVASWLPDEKTANEWQNFVNGQSFSSTRQENVNTSMKIYPTMVANVIQLNTNNNTNVTNFSYKIINVSGNLIQQSKTYTESIEISELCKGIYFVLVQIDGETFCKKIIIN